MLIEHDGHSPQLDGAAYVAPDATICGDVFVDEGCRIMHGARIIAEGGRVTLGRNAVVMQNAVVRSTRSHDCVVGSSVLIGPTAHVVGAKVEDEVFLATGTSIFHGSRIGRRSVVRIHGVVHVNSVLPADAIVPIGWVAVGDPAQLFSTDKAEEIWSVQEKLKFTQTAYGMDGALNTSMAAVTQTVSERLASHADDTVYGP